MEPTETPSSPLVIAATAVVSELHLEATRIAQRRFGPIDAGEVGSIVVALATVYAMLASKVT